MPIIQTMNRISATPVAGPEPRPPKLRMSAWTTSSAREAMSPMTATARLHVAATVKSTSAKGRNGPRLISPPTATITEQPASARISAPGGSRRRRPTGSATTTASTGGIQLPASQTLSGNR